MLILSVSNAKKPPKKTVSNLILFRVKLDTTPVISRFLRGKIMDANVVANYLTSLKNKNKLTYDAIADKCQRSESTVKNLCLGKSDDPRLDTVAPVVYAMGGSLDEMLNPGKSKDALKEVSVISLREAYEYQISVMKETNEAHITNLRAHYERHIEELKEHHKTVEAHYEKRLADKRDHIETILLDKKWFRLGFCVSIFVFAALCVAELLNPNLGWFRY